VVWVGRERRLAVDVEAMKVTPGGGRIRLQGLYVRVSGARGQDLSLAAQEAVRGAMTGGSRMPSSVFTACTRQILRFQGAGGRLPTDLFEMQDAP
jgi:hypothetical protein